MTANLTRIDGVPNSEDVNTARGMAHFPGTGPAGKTCGSCAHRGYSRQGQREYYDQKTDIFFRKFYHYCGCEMFKALTGKHGPVISRGNLACKYFENDVRR